MSDCDIQVSVSGNNNLDVTVEESNTGVKSRLNTQQKAINIETGEDLAIDILGGVRHVVAPTLDGQVVVQQTVVQTNMIGVPLFIQDDAPSYDEGNYMWIQTNYLEAGACTMWIEDGS